MAEREHRDQGVGAGRKRGEARWCRRVAERRSRWCWEVLGSCEVVLEREDGGTGE